MARDDWFRNADWDAGIEAAFFTKLARARDKSQYLRIQACTLARRHPQVALRLLDKYFSLGEHFDHAQAYVDRASAHLALGDTEQAVLSYEAALDCEERRPNFKTQAYLDLPFLIASKALATRYEQALDLLQLHKSRLTFPVDYFRWNAAYALIAVEVGLIGAARQHAQSALSAAAKEHSGFRNHADVGLVNDNYEGIRRRLSVLAA